MKILIYIILFLIVTHAMNAEHYDFKFKPKSLDKDIKVNIRSQENIGTEILPAPNIDSVLKDDEKQSNDLHNRFGVAIKTSFNIENSGTWDTLPDGCRIWRLRIVCPNAFSLNFTLFNVLIPENCQLFIYDENYKRILGAITSRHNKKDKIFDTDLIDGENAIFEFFEPADSKKKGFFEIGWIVYGLNPALISINKKEIKGSDKILAWNDCRRDVNCSEGDEWCKEKRAVVKFWLKSSQSEAYDRYGSTGVLLNDQDNNTHYPYIFTSSSFYDLNPNYFPNQYTRINFSYYNDECDGNTTTPSPVFFTGATYKASWNENDGGTMFALVQMMEQPEVNDKVYFAPWSYYEDITSNPEPQPRVTVLHHPQDEKMNISIDANVAVKGDENNSQPPTDELYWVINASHDSFNYGSEGAPFFNSDHKVIAQMEEFFHPCAYPNNGTLRQTGGRFSKSWLGNGTFTSSLHHWLAPNWTSGDLSLDGWGYPVYIRGRDYDLDDNPPLDICNWTTMLSCKTFFNIDDLYISGGYQQCSPTDSSLNKPLPFFVSLFAEDSTNLRNGIITVPDFPVQIDFRSTKRIIIQPCTKLNWGSFVTAKIECSQEPISDSDPWRSCNECLIHPCWYIAEQDNGSKTESINIEREKYFLYQNEPNPFSEYTDISYYIGEPGPVKIEVFNSLGIKLADLVNLENQKPGRYSVRFNYSGLESGVYFYTLQGNGFFEIKKMMLMK